jgi:hypothetical protein
VSLRIAIVGRHPTLEPGFNAAMSLDEALGFEAHGCEVTLCLPISPDHDPDALLASQGLDYDTLDRFGGSFDIRPIASAADVSADVLVWQSYRASEHQLLLQFKDRDILRTKNPPRMLTGHLEDDRRRAAGSLKQLDLVALSLQADMDILLRDHPDLAAHYAYVPRGFVPEWLHGRNRSDRPTVGLDRAIKPANEDVAPARAHIIETVLRLRKNYPDLHALTLREQVAEIGSERIPHVPLRDYYDRFINRLHIYFPIDFEQSVHVSGLTRSPEGQRIFTGLYENQIVETQMAGGLIVSRRDDIPTELIMLPGVSLVESYDDIDALVEVASAHLDNFEARSAETRRLATERHSHIRMTAMWLDAIATFR